MLPATLLQTCTDRPRLQKIQNLNDLALLGRARAAKNQSSHIFLSRFCQEVFEMHPRATQLLDLNHFFLFLPISQTRVNSFQRSKNLLKIFFSRRTLFSIDICAPTWCHNVVPVWDVNGLRCHTGLIPQCGIGRNSAGSHFCTNDVGLTY